MVKALRTVVLLTAFPTLCILSWLSLYRANSLIQQNFLISKPSSFHQNLRRKIESYDLEVQPWYVEGIFKQIYAPIFLLWDEVLLKSDQSSIMSFLDRRVCYGSHDTRFVVSERINCKNKEYFQVKRLDFAVEKLNFYQKVDFFGKFL